MWDFIDKLATIIGLIGFIVSGIAAWNARKLCKETELRWQKENEQISVVLRNLTREIRLPVEIKRGDFTRSELLGLIGMLPTENKQRFEINFFSTSEFSQQLDSIRESGAEFIIKCSEKELDQFKHEKQPVVSTYPTS